MVLNINESAIKMNKIDFNAISFCFGIALGVC